MAEVASASPTPASNVTPTIPNQPTPDNQAASHVIPTPSQLARMMKLKVDGQDLELPESEVIALAQQGRSATKRFQEAAATRKEAEMIIQFAKDNPQEFFAKTGQNARQWAEQYLLGEIQREAMTPEARELADLKAEKAQRAKHEEAMKQRQTAEKEQADMLAQSKIYDELFTKALSEVKVPKTAYAVKRMAELTQVALRKGLNVDAAKIAQLVKEDYEAEHKMIVGEMDGESLLAFLGKDAVKRLSKAQLSQYKSTKGTTAKQPQTAKEPEKAQSRFASWKEFQKKTRALT